jgi:hypothetical protein
LKKEVMKNLLKQIIGTGTLILLSTLFSFSQIQFGGVVGINSSTQSEFGNIYNNEGIYCNLNAGLVSRYEFDDRFAIKANVLYSQKGRSFDISENGAETNRTDKFSYLEIPVKAEFSTPLGKQKLFAAVGPYLDFLLDSKKEVNNISTSLNDQTKGADYGVAMEIGIELPVASHAFQFSLNYDMGLSKIADYDSDLRNKTLSLNVSWLF